MFDLFHQPELTGAQLRDNGIEAAISHANRKVELWGEKAYSHFLNYLKTVSEFKTEDAREYAQNQGLEEPPSKRAWGAVVVRLAKENRIFKIGHATVNNPKAHRCFATVWGVNK